MLYKFPLIKKVANPRFCGVYVARIVELSALGKCGQGGARIIKNADGFLLLAGLALLLIQCRHEQIDT
jgi:hypothetical protein